MIDEIIKSSFEYRLIRKAQSGIVYVQNKIQKALLDGELMGQISDGMWENSKPYDHYIPWARAKVMIGGQGTKGISTWVKRNYNFLNSELLNVVGDRMLGMARLIKKFPNIGGQEKLISIANSFADSVMGMDYEKLSDLREYSKKGAKELMKVTKASFQDLILIVNDNSLYSGSDLRKDLKEIKTSFQTVLDESFEPQVVEDEDQKVVKKDEIEKLILDRNLYKKYVKIYKKYFQIRNMKKPIWEAFLTLVRGGSKKFHYFGVMMTDDRKFSIANLYGKLGTLNPKVVDLGTDNSKINAINIAKKKMRQKLRKYDEGKIEK